ncbi:MAG: sugar phosphate isomerase/epimerase [Acidobacteriota bacterium]
MIVTRRYFLATLPLLATVNNVTVSAPRAACQTNAWPIEVGDFGQLLAVIRRMHSLEFEGFETSFRNLEGQFQASASAQAAIRATGVQLVGVHIFLQHYDPTTSIPPADLIQRIADGAAALGSQRLILSGKGLAFNGHLQRSALQRKAEALQKAARYCSERSLRLAYHNHQSEFALDGEEIEGLCENTDSELLDLILDAGHAFRAGVDLERFFRRRHSRIAGIHLRDFHGEEQVPLGRGEVKFDGLAAAIRQMRWEGWLIAEEERASGAKPGETAAGQARQTLRRVFGV